jgi:hypothetical protein
MRFSSFLGERFVYLWVYGLGTVPKEISFLSTLPTVYRQQEFLLPLRASLPIHPKLDTGGLIIKAKL